MHVKIWPTVQHEMPLISCIKGDHLIIPGALRWSKGPGRSAGPCCSFLMKGGGWKESLSMACSVPQAPLCRRTAGTLQRATALRRSQYCNNHKDKHLPMKQATDSSPQALLPPLGEDGVNLYHSQSVVTF